MTYAECEQLQRDGGEAYPLMLFRWVTMNPAHHELIHRKLLLQRWRIHGEQGWYEDWIEVPELEKTP